MDLDRLINWAAGQASRAYPQITFEDTKQELWAHCHANLPRFFEYMQRGEDGERLIRVALNMEARKYAIRERQEVTGISYGEQAWYTPNAIRAILPDVYEYEDWQTFEKGSTEGRSKPVQATGDRLAAIIDVKDALGKLLPDQRDILRHHYQENLPLVDVAEIWGISEMAAKQRLNRAVYAIREKLGGPRPADPYEAVNGQFDTRTSGRRAMSNSAARALTDKQWSE